MLSNCGAGEDSLRVPWTERRSNQSILKEISPGISLERMMLKLKLQYFGHFISSSVILVSSCLQSFPASGSFPMSQFFTSGGQSIGASPSASVLSRNKSGLISFRMDWLDLLAAQWTLKESSPAPQFEGINSLALRPLYGPTLTSIHDYWKNHTFDYTDLCWQSDVSAF